MSRSSDHALHVNLLSIKDIKISNLEKKVKQLEKENNLLKEELLYLRRNLNL